MIEDFYEITENGELLSPDWVDKALGCGDFTTIKKVIGAQWKFNGSTVEKKYDYVTIPKLLPTLNAVIITEKSNLNKLDDELVIYEPDGSERFRIKVPIISEHSDTDKAYFYWTEFDKNTSEVFQILNDGAVDYKAKLNVETGELSDFEQTRV